MLEMIRQKVIVVTQNVNFGEITIKINEDKLNEIEKRILEDGKITEGERSCNDSKNYKISI